LSTFHDVDDEVVNTGPLCSCKLVSRISLLLPVSA
jgi:hypothetical protein